MRQMQTLMVSLIKLSSMSKHSFQLDQTSNLLIIWFFIIS
jgi:hypothetical protein